MGSSGESWWGRHGWTLIVLLSAFSLAFLVRTIWNTPLFIQWGPSYLFAGGSDSFYHWRVSDYILLNHRNLVIDPLLKYPFTGVNPREPLFDWMNAILGILLAPFFGGNAELAGRFSLELAAPLWAALSVFPIYLLGREVSSRRMGLVAALIWPFLVANIDSSTFGYANYLSFYTFFILVMIYSYLRMVRAAGTRRHVESYRRPRAILAGVRGFVRIERNAIKWSVFTGVAFGAVILTWQGYTFLVAMVVVFLVLQMIIERIRGVDSFGLYLSNWIVGGIGFPMAFPYYFAQGDYHIWFLEPVLIYFGALLILLPFLLLRDQPWVISVPALVATAGVAIGAIRLLVPATFADILSGQGYFVKTLIYTTVAEAQAPSIDSLIIGYGVVTFFLAFAGLAFVGFQLVRGRFQRRHMMFLVFSVISIYLPISAAKFFYIGSAAFSLLPAEAFTRLLDVGGFPALRRNVASLSDRRSQLSAFRKSFKIRHVLVLVLVIGIMLPNAWTAIDAGIPYNSKSQYNTQVFDSLPAPLRVSPTNASTYYFGAAGSQLDTPNQYDESGYDWLAQQDANLPPPQRPALVSWWDYGFQTVSEGHHPAVADNFQNGIDPSGNFLLAQNESLAIGVLTATLLSAEALQSGQPYLPNGLNAVLARDGVDLPTLHTLLANESRDIPIVIGHPERYLAVDPTHLDAQNAMYDTVSYFLATTLSISGVASVYDDVQAYTGASIRYAMVDSRLIPFSGSNTGIFYAPADLTDRVIGSGGEPVTYFGVTIVGSDGNTYVAGTAPAGVTPVTYNINYLAPFYNSMIYRTYFGYNGTQVGQSPGFPAVQGSGVANDQAEPGWMLQHFQVVYRTAYYCNQPAGQASGGCYVAKNLPEAQSLAKRFNGTADVSSNSYYQGGEAILEYYPGQPVTGTVALPNGQGVPNARVTVYDSWGIPHMTTVTASDGSYSLLLPPGHDTLNVSTGTLNLLTEAGGTPLATTNLTIPDSYGLSLDAPLMVHSIVLHPAVVDGLVYWKHQGGSSYTPGVDTPVVGATVVLWGHRLATFQMATDSGGSFVFPAVPPAAYNVSVLYRGSNFTQSPTTALPGKTVNVSSGLSAGKILGTVREIGPHPAVGATVIIAGPSGVVAQSVTNARGNYTITDIGPGNYSVTASLVSQGLGSTAAAARITSTGSNASVDLLVVPIVPFSATILKNGAPVSGIAVRFTQLVPPAPPVLKGNASSNGTGATSQQKANTTVALTGPDGVAHALLPAGNYSVYALGVNGSTYYSGFWSGPVALGGAAPELAIAPAVELSGLLNISGSAATTAPGEIAVYDPSGHVMWAFTNGSLAWSLWLPSGTYSVESYEATSFQSVISRVVLTNATYLHQSLFPGGLITASVRVAGTNQPLAGATVNFTIVPISGTVTVHSDDDGNASAVLPTAPYGRVQTSYCVNVSAVGFLPHDSCGLVPLSLVSLPPILLVPTLVPITVTVDGLAPGKTVTVNLTATSATARSATIAGVSPLSVSLPPGNYTVSASSPATPSGEFLPAAPVRSSIPFGARAAGITIALLLQVRTHGQLSFPPGSAAARASVSLYSSAMDLTVSGAVFTGGFYVAPGTYTYLATVPTVAGTAGWASYGTLAIDTLGDPIAPTLTLTGLAGFVLGTVRVASGAPLTSPISVGFSLPSGIEFPVAVPSGTFNVLLPNLTFTMHAATTATILVKNVSTLVSLTSPAGAACAVRPVGTVCDVTLVETILNLTVGGRLAMAGSGAPIVGTVELIGPLPLATARTVATASDGSFSLGVARGSYALYALSGSGAFAAVETIALVTANLTGLTVPLTPAWTATVVVEPPAGESVGPATVTFHAFGTPTIPFQGVVPGVPIAVALPRAVYEVNATAASNPYGVPTNATATGSLPLLGGNGALDLPLAEQLIRAVSISVTIASTGVVNITLPPSGGSLAFGYVVRNTGNTPVNLTLSGSPAFWNYTIRPSNLTLPPVGPGAVESGSFLVVVPAGTPVLHAAVQIQAKLAGTSQVIGVSNPPPPVAIRAASGLLLGASASVTPVVTPTEVTLALYARNTGNFAEGVALSIVDGTRLAGLGWKVFLKSGGTILSGPLNLPVEGNTSFSVVLNASSGAAIPPGSVTLLGSTLNRTAASATSTVTVGVPIIAVALNGSAVAITGPGLGSPPPYPDAFWEFLVFVPALAFLAIAVASRWYRRRRWTR